MSIFNAVINNLGILCYILLTLTLALIAIWKKWYILDKRNLFEQKLFWLAIGVPFISFIYFGLFSWWGKAPVLSAHGYARFYEISKFPLLLLASSVPLASIVNNIHRTIQTEAQIDAAETKNAIDRHLAHEKNFVEKVKELLTYDIRSAVNHKGDLRNHTFKGDDIEPDDAVVNFLKTRTLKVTNPYLLYSKIYKQSTTHPDSDYTPCKKFLEKTEDLLGSIDKNLNTYKNYSQLPTELYIKRLSAVANDIALLLDILDVESTSNLLIEIKKENISTIIFTDDEMIFADILEAVYYMVKKLIFLVYGVQVKNYNHLHTYLYNGDKRFDFDAHIVSYTDFYSPEWKSYTTTIYCIHPEGDSLAAES